MAITIKQGRPIAVEELRELSRRNPGYQLERGRDGRLIVTPTGGKSGYRSGEVFRQLAEWNHKTGGGIVFDSSTGFRMPDGSVLSPDVAWVARERWEVLSPDEQEGFPPLCPDVVFEIRSKSDTVAELHTKMNAYVANGAQLCVLIDPYRRCVELWRSDGQTNCFVDEPRIVTEPSLDEFVLETEGLYE